MFDDDEAHDYQILIEAILEARKAGLTTAGELVAGLTLLSLSVVDVSAVLRANGFGPECDAGCDGRFQCGDTCTLELFARDGMSVEQIADELGISKDDVASIEALALEKLKGVPSCDWYS